MPNSMGTAHAKTEAEFQILLLLPLLLLLDHVVVGRRSPPFSRSGIHSGSVLIVEPLQGRPSLCPLLLGLAVQYERTTDYYVDTYTYLLS